MSYFSESEDEDDCYIDWSYEIFNHKYIMIKKLGKGSYCSVWLAYNYVSNCFNAIKIYNRCDYNRGKKEIKVFDNLKSKKISNIITYNSLFDYINEDYDDYDDLDENESNGSDAGGNTFLCVEMDLAGYSIYDIIKLFRDTDLKPPSKYYFEVTKNTINILNDIHKKGYIHSDIKPENILLNKPTYETDLIMKKIVSCKTGKLIKVTNKNVNDFIKKIKTELKNIPESKIEDIYKYIFNDVYNVIICDMGTTITPNSPKLYKKYTIYYRAPETVLKLDYDHTYDYWSLGCTVYEMITHKILFNADNDLELLYEIMSRLGPISSEVIEKSEYKKKFFTTSKRLRGYKKISFKPISELLESTDIDENLNKLINLIKSSLCLDKACRSLSL
jgi:serine/threonine-protein kinase SRPK3